MLSGRYTVYSKERGKECLKEKGMMSLVGDPEMLANELRDNRDWWAQDDTPIHSGDSRVSYYVDGRSAMFAQCCALLKARTSIYLANWGMKADLELVRGKEQRAGLDGSPEQEALLALLRTEGLRDEDILFWSTHQLSLKEVLLYARRNTLSIWKINISGFALILASIFLFWVKIARRWSKSCKSL